MRKLLIVLFLLLISAFGVVGFVDSQADNDIIEKELPSNTELVR